MTLMNPKLYSMYIQAGA